MKGGIVAAVSAALFASVNAGVHKLKLNKIPLSEQLERGGFAAQAHSLYNKYSGQKVMGVLPHSHRQEMFRDTSIHPEDEHPVPVSNFLNAQCMPPSVLVVVLR